jgi:hypothetical protein
MKAVTLIFAVLAVLFGEAPRANADFIVYGNGPINGNTNALPISNGDSVSDSFSVSTQATLTGAQHVGIWVDGGVPLTVHWSIGTTPFGSNISSGISSVSSALVNNGNILGFEVYDTAFTLTGNVNAGTTYWLTLQDATSSGIPNVPMAWDINGGPSLARNILAGDSFPQPSESFQLIGQPVPEPANSTLLVTAIVSFAGYFRWRRLGIAKA